MCSCELGARFRVTCTARWSPRPVSRVWTIWSRNDPRDAEAARVLHARVLYDDRQTFELPPLNSVLAGTIDSIRSSKMPHDAFERAWSDDAVSILQAELTV